jgi:hypothetical protein
MKYDNIYMGSVAAHIVLYRGICSIGDQHFRRGDFTVAAGKV